VRDAASPRKPRSNSLFILAFKQLHGINKDYMAFGSQGAPPSSQHYYSRNEEFMPPFPPCQAALILSLQLVGSLHFPFKFERMMEIEDHVEFHRLFTQSSSAL
jgi:hypothetical protein